MERPAIGQEVGLARLRCRWRWHHARTERARPSAGTNPGDEDGGTHGWKPRMWRARPAPGRAPRGELCGADFSYNVYRTPGRSAVSSSLVSCNL